MSEFLSAVERGCAWFGRVAAWTVPVLVVSVCISILLVQLRANVLFEWGTAVPLFGSGLTAGGLTDLQWHLFAVMVMLGGAYTLCENGHVCVDFLSSRFTPRTRQAVTLFGDLLLLLPFALVMTWFSWEYTVSAWTSNEGSSYGGLNQRWIIKAVMPMGFGLLAAFGLARALRTASSLLRRGS
ncbi:TRAP transporter small permease subunit [Ramlibacter sp.]|uniref:TRAP transporter small permease subunit n=1 Tax=Ramlibacter sp. TaxID=1917967 RepID=UPI002D3D99FF|nr:TRAP transporter small permease subunit [Ramlibacter sp.]HYD76456.1 TRAP transporter small permease subunit [Ramlibacter sp.]